MDAADASYADLQQYSIAKRYSNILQQCPTATPCSKVNSPQSQDMQVRRAFVEWSND